MPESSVTQGKADSEACLNGKPEVSKERASFSLTHCENWRGCKNSMNSHNIHTARVVSQSRLSYLHGTDSLPAKERLQTEITTRGFLCNPNAFCWPDLPTGTQELLRGSISYSLWNPVHILFSPTFSNYYLLQLHLNNVAMHCHVIHLNKTKLQS